MPAIGIDTHKRTLAACAVDDVGGVLGERTFSCEPAGFVELAAWAAGVAPEARIGVEGSASYGAPVAHHLIAAGFVVREVQREEALEELWNAWEEINKTYGKKSRALGGRYGRRASNPR